MLIIGAKGFAKELLEAILQENPDRDVVLYDDVNSDAPELLFDKYRIIQIEDDAARYLSEIDERFALGVGNPHTRLKLCEKFIRLGGKLATVISPFAKIGSNSNVIGEGTNILTNAVIESENTIGRGCLIHVGTLISHNVSVGDFCEISPNSNLLGNVKVGNFCSLGTGSIILPNLSVGDNAVVGAGAVVTQDVPNDVTVIGIPARILSK